MSKKIILSLLKQDFIHFIRSYFFDSFSFQDPRSVLLGKGGKEKQSAPFPVHERDRRFGKQNQGLWQKHSVVPGSCADLCLGASGEASSSLLSSVSPVLLSSVHRLLLRRPAIVTQSFWLCGPASCGRDALLLPVPEQEVCKCFHCNKLWTKPHEETK